MNGKKIVSILMLVFLLTSLFVIAPSEKVEAGTYDGQDLALAILANQSWLVDSTYTDTDDAGHRQAGVFTSLGIMQPTDGSSFAVFSTGIAGNNPVTTDGENPGDERGSCFEGGQQGYPRDEATLTMTLNVPDYMHYLYYDAQFFSSEYPEYVGTQYNDKFTVTVNSPSEGSSQYFFDVNSGYFVLDSNSLSGSGFGVFAQSGYPGGVDLIDTTPRSSGADAGASDLIPIGGAVHPVSPNEQITVTINIKDSGDNLFDSAAFIDNLVFSGYARTDIVARKTAHTLQGDRTEGPLETGDTIRYSITISNTGTADQANNPGNEFEDFIPENTTYVAGSATATSGSINYDSANNKIIWNGAVTAESSIILTFDVTINQTGILSSADISNQGTIYWDSNEDGTNDATELTDDPYTNDGIDQDGDGDTNDDDPTNVSVIIFESPDTVTEDFSDDTPGGSATESYQTRSWFSTSSGEIGNTFEVAQNYYYSTAQSFKTKLRSSGSPQYWNYTLSELESDISYWEVWFRCGNASEASDLCLTFKNSLGSDIAKLKLEYVQQGTRQPTDWVLQLFYWSSSSGWTKLYSECLAGYLYNDWYKIKIEKNSDTSFINYYLYQGEESNLVDFKTDANLGAAFSDLSCVEWKNTQNPVACPMFFWDEHILGLE